MQLKILIDKEIPQEEITKFIDNLSKCTNGIQFNELVDRTSCLFDSEPPTMYVMSKDKRWLDYGDVNIED